MPDWAACTCKYVVGAKMPNGRMNIPAIKTTNPRSRSGWAICAIESLGGLGGYRALTVKLAMASKPRMRKAAVRIAQP